MRHTLRDVAFEVPDALSDFSDYSYESLDRSAVVVFQTANDEPGDGAALLANARARFEGMYGPLIIYCSPITLTRGDGSAVAAVEGEQRDLSDRSKRLRFAIASIATDRGKAVILYNCVARSDAFPLFRQIIRTVFLLGDTIPAGSQPRRWSQRQANAMLLAVPHDWTEPSTLVFRSDIELRITTAEPVVPAGHIDLGRELPASRPNVLSSKIETISTPEMQGWIGEWSVADELAGTQATTIRKMSVRLTRETVATVYEKGPAGACRPLDVTWQTVRSSLRSGGRTT